MRAVAIIGCAVLLPPGLAGAQSGSAEATIRRLRASSNASIARHDTSGVAAILAPGVIVVTSNSVHAIGRAENVRLFADQFRSRPDVRYERLPDEVRLYDPWGMASELGRWTGSWTDADGRIAIAGRYFAKWRLTNGAWLVESETYVPESCTGGAYCRRIP